jgi:hypothetical protein
MVVLFPLDHQDWGSAQKQAILSIADAMPRNKKY